MTDQEPQTVEDLYRHALDEIAAEHGADYARDTAALTIATLVSMVSHATYRLPRFPIYLPPKLGESGTDEQPSDDGDAP